MNTHTPQPVKPKYALINSFSGVVGEMRIAAEFIRCGIQVAKPYWNDDEIDLLVFRYIDNHLIPIPVQIKSIQYLPRPKGRVQKTKQLQGLKKIYVERQAPLCLAVYEPNSDRIWFVAGANNIKKIYADQHAKGRKKKAYKDVDENSDLPISWDAKPDSEFDRQFLLDKDDPRWLYKMVSDLAKRIRKTHDLTKIYKRIFRN
jgi:hypothetical protein